jgi:diguanylate cyclase (GGDEF)-like protein/PAS domain S-box-containing protein
MELDAAFWLLPFALSLTGNEPESAADQRLAALLSITDRMDGFLYRCRNDPSYTMLYISEGIQRVSGYPATDIIGNMALSYASIIHPEDLAVVDAAVLKGLEIRGNWNVDYRLVPSQGAPIWVREIGGGVFAESGDLEFLEGFVIDITELKQLEESNKKALEYLRVANQELQAAKDAAEQAQRTAEEMRIAAEQLASDMDMSRASLERQASETVALAEDLAAQKAEVEAAREQSEYLANHDILTGLPNRRAFQERLRSFMNEIANDGVGLLFIDLDKFKDVNDTLGHDAGDELLVRVAEKLREIVRDNDFVARLGGDEFAVLLKADEDLLRGKAAAVGQRILEKLQIPMPSPKGVIQVGCTVGIAAAPGDAADAQELMACADQLMYVGKKRGRNRLITTADLVDGA